MEELDTKVLLLTGRSLQGPTGFGEAPCEHGVQLCKAYCMSGAQMAYPPSCVGAQLPVMLAGGERRIIKFQSNAAGKDQRPRASKISRCLTPIYSNGS